MTLSQLQTQVVPWKLWSMVGCLVLADAVFLTVWQLVDPLKKSVQHKIVGNLRYVLHFPGKSQLLEQSYLRMRTRTSCTSRRSGCAGLVITVVSSAS